MSTAGRAGLGDLECYALRIFEGLLAQNRIIRSRIVGYREYF
jgi:hypothetical protein